ncbi:sigma 54-interacting transcriptional regulator [Exilibacterium tricleocarpae]|nr:sigma 54-interacting transcriptional regulator [Exilibacterium tricleocarpae]
MVSGNGANLQLPRVLIFGYREFSHLVSSLLAEFQTRAEFRIVDSIVDSFADLSTHIADFSPDVVVSAGSNAAYLKSALDLPVVSLEVTESDIVEAVTKAAAVTDTILMISFNAEPRILPHLESSLGVKITYKRYRTPEEARETFYVLSKQPWGAVLGASFICGLATQEGFKSFLFYSRESCRRMLLRAIDTGIHHRDTKNSRALSNWIIERSPTPTLVVGHKGRLHQVNAAAKTDLHLGADLSLELADLIKPQAEPQPQDGECRINGQDWWFHRDRVDDGFGEPVDIYQLYRHKLQFGDSHSPDSYSPAVETDSELRYRSAAMARVMETVAGFSRSPSNVLITGESGTGKELVARAIHRDGPFAGGQFIGINCGAIPTELFEGELFGHRDGAFTGSRRGGRKGLIEAAAGGVLFLDEIGELTLDQQTKLLRFLQERTVRRLGSNKETQINLKIVAASNKPLRQMVGAGDFREDLFYRLNVFNIELPPLRRRREDIECIALFKLEYFLDLYALRVPAQALIDAVGPALAEYAWPGNVRELENVIERMVAHLTIHPDYSNLAGALPSIAPELFSDAVHEPLAANPRQRELQLVAQAMDEFHNDKQKVAEYLGISQTTLWRRLKQLSKN